MSENANLEDPPQEGEPFNYEATPSQFFFGLESIGNLEPDAVVQQGIKVMQQKLAAVLQELAGNDTNGESGAGGFGGQEADGLQDEQDYGGNTGYITPFVNPGGATSAYGGAATPGPYGATPYGTSGWS